jgi:hypothetical protein
MLTNIIRTNHCFSDKKAMQYQGFTKTTNDVPNASYNGKVTLYPYVKQMLSFNSMM